MSYSNVFSEETDEIKYSGEFVLTKSGSIDFGEISPEVAKIIKRQAGKIRLKIGYEITDSNGVSHGVGEKHIERETRLNQLRQYEVQTTLISRESYLKNKTPLYKKNGVPTVSSGKGAD